VALTWVALGAAWAVVGLSFLDIRRVPVGRHRVAEPEPEPEPEADDNVQTEVMPSFGELQDAVRY
jgi:hypothetical protein